MLEQEPDDIKRVDCVLSLGEHKFDVEIGVESICHGPADSSAGAPVARTDVDGQIVRGAEGHGKLDAVRALAYWINKCLDLNESSFHVALPIERDEYRKWQ